MYEYDNSNIVHKSYLFFSVESKNDIHYWWRSLLSGQKFIIKFNMIVIKIQLYKKKINKFFKKLKKAKHISYYLWV